MGDRANVYIQDNFTDDVGIYIYSHWGGVQLFHYTVDALMSDESRERWHDAPYLTRIILKHILDVSSGSSIGVSATRTNGDRNIMVIDTQNLRLAYRDEGDELPRVLSDEGISFDGLSFLANNRNYKEV